MSGGAFRKCYPGFIVLRPELENKYKVHYDHEPTNSEEMAMSRVGKRLYELIFKPYTFKQWAKYPKGLGPEVTARIPLRNDHNDLYFPNDTYQALPTHRYTALFEHMIMNHPKIDVCICQH